jgi:hypothetical protein
VQRHVRAAADVPGERHRGRSGQVGRVLRHVLDRDAGAGADAHREPVGVARDHLVVQRHGVVGGGDVVVAVAAQRADREVEVDLRRRTRDHRRHDATLGTADRAVRRQPGEGCHVERLAAGPRVDARVTQRLLCRSR